MHSFRVSVTELASLVCRTGNLELTGAVGPSARDGQKAHQRWQKASNDNVEVSVKATIPIDGSTVKLTGRIDALNALNHHVTEIKSTLVPAEHLSNLRNEVPTCESETLSADEIEAFGHSVLQRYINWMVCVEQHRQSARSSAKTLEFPFPNFRNGQRNFAAVVFRGARDGFSSLCEAPTGIGKTISALYPAIKAIGEQHVQQVMYLTAKASNGSCELDENAVCPMTLGFFDRLPAAREELLNIAVITPAKMDEVAWRHRLCPFELALQMLPWMSIVVCDYNYLFDPLVRLPWFSEPRRKALVLVDEAHNLPDRSRAMFSAQLDRAMGHSVQAALNGTHPALVPRIAALDRLLLKHARGLNPGENIQTESPEGFRQAVSAAVETLMEAMSGNTALPREAIDWFKALCRYAAIDDLYGDAHRTVTAVDKKRGKRDVKISLMCLDASAEMHKLYKNYRSLCFFSATLHPIPFYQVTLGAPDQLQALQLPSPFAAEQAKHLIVSSVSTRYRQRDESLDALVQLIHDVCSANTGSYLVFLPSFTYLEKVWQAFTDRFPQHRVWKQTQTDTREHRQAQLEALEQAGERCGFVILGGVFGEGVDYVGSRLIGAIVVGVGLPAMSAEQELMTQHYRASGFDGYDFASRIPGLVRVLQTVGRVIRTETDRGVIVLVDDRFQATFYRKNFPSHWDLSICRDRSEWVEALNGFWSSKRLSLEAHL